ncbi:MAG TPA: FecR family protein, partial [Burkholderiales bacterium]|nr:FecR family protein [Burkholderiales bacterium]
AAQANVARVDFAIGEVSAVAPDGERRLLAKGSELRVGDTVSIRQGRAQLRFTDGAYVSLQPGTEFRIEEFRFSGKLDPADGIVMHLLKGGMRTITGLIGRANRQNYKLRTDFATIGIRGTEFSVRYTDSVEVFCAEGAIFVQNEAATLALNGGEGARVLSARAAPVRTDEPPVLSPEASPAAQQLDDPTNPIQEALPFATVPVKIIGNWAAAYLAKVDAGTGVPIEVESNGKLRAFDDSQGANFQSTSAVHLDGSDGISWGRWTNGSVGGTGSYLGSDTKAVPLHWVAGLPTASLPTGSASYAMIGATPPSCVPLCTAALNGSSLLVNFDNSALDLSVDITVNGVDNYSGTVPLKISGSTFSGGGSFSGAALSGSLAASGFFSGDAAARAGLAYHLATPLLQDVNGAIAYARR